MDEKKITRRLSRVGIYGNILLSAFKLFAGIRGRSEAMISDAVHSLSDVFATFIALIGTRLAARPGDREHPYGHERFEDIASLILGTILLVTGIGIGKSGVTTILSGDYAGVQPTVLPLIAAIVSIVTKEAMYRYTIRWADKLNSSAFRADAWHHRSDALSSLGSFAGILGARLGLPVLDPVASLVICLFILKVGFTIIRDALAGMLDSACSEEQENALRTYIGSCAGVESVDVLRTRRFGNGFYVDAEISVARNCSLVEAHDVAEAVHAGVEKNFPGAKHIMIHVNPGPEEP